MDKWLANANESLNECSGVGDVHETQRQLDTVNVSTANWCPSKHIYIDNIRASPIAFPRANT